MVKVTFKNVTFAYRRRQPVFRDLKLHFASTSRRGEILALVGASGSGKTTLLRLLAGVETCNKGEIEIVPGDCAIAYVPQDVVLFEHLSLDDNLRFFGRIKAQEARYDDVAVDRLAELLNVRPLLDGKRPVNELSGGERQRVALVRSLALHPDILLLDEPCSGLDSPIKAQILRELKQVVDEQHTLAVYASHYLSELIVVADSVLYIPQTADGANRTVLHIPVDRFVRCPPTVECAKALVGPAASVLRCTFDGCRLRLPGRPIEICRCSTLGTIATGDCLVVFGPDALQASEDGPIVPDRVATSNQSWFISISGEESWLVSQRHVSSLPERFKLSGSAFVFSDGGRNPGEKVNLVADTA